jgi:lysophospholipase L1-like esterase
MGRDYFKRLTAVFFKALAGTAMALFMLISFALLLEGVTRVAYHFTSRRFIHPYLGETHKPWHQQTAVTPEGETFVFTLNNYGFRGPDIPARKLSGVRYVFTLGGSTTACNEYPHERTWPGFLQHQLRQKLSDDQLYIYNAGMASATSYRSLVTFLNILTRLSPDLLIVYEGINDRGPFRPSSARYFRDIGYGEEFFRRPSYLLHELAKRTHNRVIMHAEELLQTPTIPTEDFGYHEKNYRDIAYLARGYRVPLMFMTQPVMPEAGSNEGINRSTQDLGRELNVPVFDLAAMMPLDYDHFLPDTVHYTERGNLWIADQLAQWIIGQGLL